MIKLALTFAVSILLLSGCSAPSSSDSGGSGGAAPPPPSAKCGCKAVAGKCGCAHCRGSITDDTKCPCISHTKDGCACACKGVAGSCLCGHCATGGGKCNCAK